MLTEAMKRQFTNAFAVLEAAIPSFRDDQWRQGSAPFNGPARAVAHALQCAGLYTCEGKADWSVPYEEVPSQEQALQCLQQARRKTMEWVDLIGDEGLDKPRQSGDVTTGLERITYAMRHLQHHTGEVCAYQKQYGIEPSPWK